jgi:hypothetical protein
MQIQRIAAQILQARRARRAPGGPVSAMSILKKLEWKIDAALGTARVVVLGQRLPVTPSQWSAVIPGMRVGDMIDVFGLRVPIARPTVSGVCEAILAAAHALVRRRKISMHAVAFRGGVSKDSRGIWHFGYINGGVRFGIN